MRRTSVAAIFSAFTLTAVMWGSGAAQAASPSQTSCESGGGTFSRDGGQVSCTYTTVDPVGNSENSGGQSQTNDTTTSDSSNGTLNNDPKFASTSDCTGPGNSGSGGGQCP